MEPEGLIRLHEPERLMVSTTQRRSIQQPPRNSLPQRSRYAEKNLMDRHRSTMQSPWSTRHGTENTNMQHMPQRTPDAHDYPESTLDSNRVSMPDHTWKAFSLRTTSDGILAHHSSWHLHSSTTASKSTTKASDHYLRQHTLAKKGKQAERLEMARMDPRF